MRTTRHPQTDHDAADVRSQSSESRPPPIPEPPLQPDQEWANALTHGLAACGALLLGLHLVLVAMPSNLGMTLACAAYSASVFGTFFFSTLSHVVRRQPLLNSMRAYDQAMIYMMISGTYTPIIVRYASDSHRDLLLWAIWIAAVLGFFKKVALRYRVNAIGTYTYLLLGWLPAIPLASEVPAELVRWMLIGGVVYTIGVFFLMNDQRLRYMHAAWHLCVMAAAAVHYYGILQFVTDLTPVGGPIPPS